MNEFQSENRLTDTTPPHQKETAVADSSYNEDFR